MTSRATKNTDRFVRYLDRRADLGSRPLVSGSLDDVKQVVVIPMLSERDAIEGTLGSLAKNASESLRATLIIGVVNNRTDAHIDEGVRRDNEETLHFFRELAEGETKGPLGGLRIGYIDASSEGRELGPKEGVGTARKLGLDWGLEVLRSVGTSNGVLICLDADTWVEPNYLEAVRKHFDVGQGWAAVIDFAHRLDGPEKRQAAIVAYELYLHYHVLGLDYAGSPYAYHAVGSTIVCAAEAYVAAGGMNRRQAGEDFYFLEALAKTGRVDRICATTVHPSSRSSRRTPFGTGKRVERFLRGDHEERRVYHPDTYEILRAWLEIVSTHRDADAEFLMGQAMRISKELGAFLQAQGFEALWPKLQANARDADALLGQFHRWFDGFMTLKLIHHLRDNGFSELDTFDALKTLMAWRGGPSIDPDMSRNSLEEQIALLEVLRGLDRDFPYRPIGDHRRWD